MISFGEFILVIMLICVIIITIMMFVVVDLVREEMQARSKELTTIIHCFDTFELHHATRPESSAAQDQTKSTPKTASAVDIPNIDPELYAKNLKRPPKPAGGYGYISGQASSGQNDAIGTAGPGDHHDDPAVTI